MSITSLLSGASFLNGAMPLSGVTSLPGSNTSAGPSGNTGGQVGGSPIFNIKDDFFGGPSWTQYLNGGAIGTRTDAPMQAGFPLVAVLFGLGAGALAWVLMGRKKAG